MANEKGRAKRKETKWPRQDLKDVLQDHIDVRATKQPELSIRLCHRAPWVCYKTNQLQRSRDAGILRTASLGYATEPTSYRPAHIMVIDKKGYQHQQQHQQHEPGVSPRAKTCLDLPTTRYQDIRKSAHLSTGALPEAAVDNERQT